MSSKSDDALYICGFSSSTIAEMYDMSYYSQAGKHKKRNIVRSLQAVGTDVTIVSPLLFTNNTFSYYPGRSIVDEETGASVHIPPAIDVYGLNFVFAALTTTVLTVSLLVRNSFDVVLFYNFRAKHAIPAAVGKVLFGLPTILDYEDGVFLHDNPFIRWSGAVLRRVCGPAVDGAVCVNRPLAAIAPTDNTVIARGFPSVGMPAELPDVDDESESTVVMFAGRFDELRGVYTFIETAAEVTDSHSVEFWISGYGPDEEIDAVQNAVDSVADPRITHFGTLPWEDYRRRLAAADIFVNFQDPTAPLSEYTFPSKLLDFMSVGGVIVSTDMSDLRQDFESLFQFVERGEPPAAVLEDVIERTESGELTGVGEQGQRWVRRNCSHEVVGEDILSLVE